MKIDEINKIRQTAEESEVNEYLAKGYRIVKIFSGKVTTDGQEFIQPVYVLGIGREKVEKEK